MDNTKIITVGIPAFKANNHIKDCLASIQIQTIKNKISVIIASDNPDDNYEEEKKCYPDLDIKILSCDKNTGPGLARQRCLDACETPWITFIDADDIFINPIAIEKLITNIIPQCIQVQGLFFQEVSEPNPQNIRMMPNNNINNPWVFGKMYNVQFLRDNDISFSSLRAMEDGEFNWKIRMLVENTPLKINIIQDPIYFWRTGSEHSITRTGIKENSGVPLYNYDLCNVGATVAAINAIKFCKKKNPFNGSITRFTVEIFVGNYLSYIECMEKKPMFAAQSLFNAKRFYNLCYKEIENQIDDKILKDMYTMQYAGKSKDFIGIIPSITFFDFIKLIKEEPYKGKEEFELIRSEYPDWVRELDLKTGVLGEEGYIYCDCEDK